MSEQSTNPQAAKPKPVPLQAATQAVPFPAGIYRFSVRAASPIVDGATGTPFPALLVAVGPGTLPGTVEFVGASTAVSAWLCNVGDVLVARINGKGATLILSSLRTPADTQPFDIQVEQVGAAAAPQLPDTSQATSLKLSLEVHLKGQGDVQFADSEWAGRAGSGVWIEAISVKPQEVLRASEIECKGLAANGFETPWLSDGAFCGSRGAGLPLIGFAVRLKPEAAKQYDVEYSAYFRSGVTVGPLRNGVPCRSKTAGDPLEAVQIRVVKRSAAVMLAGAEAKPVKAAAKPATKKGPSFSKFREEEEAVVKTPAKKAVKAAASGKTPSKALKPGAAVGKSDKATKPAGKRK